MIFASLQVVAFTGEAPLVSNTAAQAAAQLGSLGMAGTLVIFSLSGMLLNYSLFLCTMCNSALTTTIVGTLKAGRIALNCKYLPAFQADAVIISLGSHPGCMRSALRYAVIWKYSHRCIPWTIRSDCSFSRLLHALVMGCHMAVQFARLCNLPGCVVG